MRYQAIITLYGGNALAQIEFTLHALLDDLYGIGLCTFAVAIRSRDPLRQTTCLHCNPDLEDSQYQEFLPKPATKLPDLS